MCQSLLSDGDLDLTDDYARREYGAFYAGELNPQVSFGSPSGPSYSFHSPGLAVLLLPGYAAGGYLGARMIVWVLAALTGVLVHRLVRESLGGEATALAAWAAVTVVPPLSLYAMRIYPEVPAALAVAVFLLAGRRERTARSALAATVCAAVLPWLHSKFVVLAAAGLLLTLLRRGRWAWRIAAAAAFAASIGALLYFFQAHYGRASLTAAYGNPGLSLARAPRGVLALLLDRQYGLLVCAPLWFLGLSGLVVLWRRRPGDLLRAALLTAPLVGLAATFGDWSGGSDAPARYLVPLAPVLALGLAATLPAHATAATALGAAGLGVVAIAADAPRVFHAWPDGVSHLLRHLSPALDLNPLFPSFFEAGARPTLLALALVAAGGLALRFGGRGLAAGTLAYALFAGALGARLAPDPRAATEFLLMSWDGDNWTGPQGPPVLDSLRLPFAFAEPRAALPIGVDQFSTVPFSLPPGRYRLEASIRPASAGRARVRVGAFSRGLPLASLELETERPAGQVPLVLPVGALHLQVAVSALEGQAEIGEASVVPEGVVPARERRGLGWPRRGTAAIYRVAVGRLRVTVVEGCALDGEGFRVEGDCRFVVEAPRGATVEVWTERPEPDQRQALVWAGRAVPLGRLPGSRVWLSAADGVAFGDTTLVTLHLPAPGAWVRLTERPGR